MNWYTARLIKGQIKTVFCRQFNGKVLFTTGGTCCGWTMTKEEARAKYKIHTRLTDEKSEEIEERLQYNRSR